MRTPNFNYPVNFGNGKNNFSYLRSKGIDLKKYGINDDDTTDHKPYSLKQFLKDIFRL